MLKWLKPKLRRVKVRREDMRNAKEKRIHFPDCIHIQIAEKTNATLVSNDKEMQEYGAIPSHTL